jgi:hypothetical protein
LTSPTDLIKVRMQSGVAYDGLIDAFTSIVQASGLLSLWDGWQPNVQRSFIVNAAERECLLSSSAAAARHWSSAPRAAVAYGPPRTHRWSPDLEPTRQGG